MGKAVMKHNVLLLGIDGADWAFLDKWLDAGHMPNLARLVNNGVRAPLASVLPLNSAASWVSIITGRSPGGHGVFGFTRNVRDTYRRRAVSSEDIGAATLWEIVNASGEPAGVINCPITYPPPELNGFLVSGILIPHNDIWAYPPEVEKNLKNLFGPYMVDVPWALVDERTPGARENFLADLYLMTRKQEEVALKCMAVNEWSVAAVFFTGTDRIMHRFWHHADQTHPARDPESAKQFGDEIRKYFSLIDDVIGRILDKAGDVLVMVVSDHGFGALHHRFNLRYWLAQKGFLVEGGSDKAIEVDEALEGIDMSKSKAYPASLSESGVCINLEGRQSAGIVSRGEYEDLRNRIIRELEEFRVIDGQRPVKRAIKKECLLS